MRAGIGLDGADLLQYAVQSFGHQLVHQGRVVALAALFSAFSALAPLSVVAGGIHRGDSVRAGLAALNAECGVVLVHDGARPFVERSLIDRVIEQRELELRRTGFGAQQNGN